MVFAEPCITATAAAAVTRKKGTAIWEKDDHVQHACRLSTNARIHSFSGRGLIFPMHPVKGARSRDHLVEENILPCIYLFIFR